MRVAFFEDGAAMGLAPIALTRPTCELVCGRFSVFERWRCDFDHHGRAGEWALFVRPELAEVCRERHPGCRVNEYAWLGDGPTLLVNGRWIADAAPALALGLDDVAVLDGTVVAAVLDPLEAAAFTEHNWDGTLAALARGRRAVEAGGVLARHPWDLVNHNAKRLEADFALADPHGAKEDLGPQVVVMGSRDRVVVHATAEIHPFVVLDARRGPITIDADAVIQSFTRLEGPCHIGRGSQLFRAHVKDGSTVGPVCRVGGEVEASILHAYVNKYHVGFLGHSYVCPWVNLGAQATNSDLKSDYGPVRVPLSGEPIDTGTAKVGCFIGDHTKAAIGSLFNTGSSIGVMCLVLPGGALLPKHVPSFARVWLGELADGWDLGRSLETARAAMSRRGVELSAAEERLLRTLERQTYAERETALQRWQEKRADAAALRAA
jgi:UDP-N-acetylglucosamine diphosphorylase/glucosamine-1-phosphate N-acetyltransferase